jgi:hypothetical protein
MHLKLTKFVATVLLFGLIFGYSVTETLAQEILPDSIVKERIQTLQNALNSGKLNADIWNYGWIAAYGTGTAVQGVVFFTSNDKSIRQDMALGGITSGLAGIFQIIDPLEVGKKAKILEKMPASTPEERQTKLAEGEELFKSLAKREKNGKSWQIHALNGAVNLSSGLITWIGFKRTAIDGLVNFALNSAISELQILTQPTRTLKDYQHYCQQYQTETGSLTYKPKPTYFVGAYPGGISIKVVF